eukprot:8525196-Pyramimonas_sp.AAC.1
MKELPPNSIQSFTFQAPATLTIAGLDAEEPQGGERAAAAATLPDSLASDGGARGGPDGPTASPVSLSEMDHVDSSSRVDQIWAERGYTAKSPSYAA